MSWVTPSHLIVMSSGEAGSLRKYVLVKYRVIKPYYSLFPSFWTDPLLHSLNSNLFSFWTEQLFVFLAFRARRQSPLYPALELTETALACDMAAQSEVQQQRHRLGACLAMQNLRPQTHLLHLSQYPQL